MKIVVVGSGGRLGAALARRYAALDHEVLGLNHADLDLADGEEIRRRLGGEEFEVLLNPAALTNVDYCEDHEAEAFAVNAQAPGLLAEICREKAARMIHISTDYVFDGRDEGPRRESDPPNPLGVYGRSKLAGEEAVLGVSGEILVVRTSWVFGPDRPSFIDYILESALEKERVEAIEDKWSTPTYAPEFAELLRPLLGAGSAGGILHLSNRGRCSWREYGQVALDCAAGLGFPLKAREVEGIAMEDLERFVAVRPRHTAMSTERYTKLTGTRPRGWEEAVAAFVADDFAPRLKSKAPA